MLARMLAVAGGGGGFTLPENFDDEFVGENVEWSIWDVLGHSADFDTTSPGRVYMESGLIVTRARLPSPPFTVEAYCASIVYDNINTPGNATLGIGYVPTSTSDGGFYGLEWDIDTPGSIGIYDGEFIPMFGDTPDHYGSITDNVAGHVNEVPHKQKLVVHSANNIDLYYTKDVTSASPTFTLYKAGVNPIVTPDCLYLVSFACTTTWEYVRFS